MGVVRSVTLVLVGLAVFAAGSAHATLIMDSDARYVRWRGENYSGGYTDTMWGDPIQHVGPGGAFDAQTDVPWAYGGASQTSVAGPWAISGTASAWGERKIWEVCDEYLGCELVSDETYGGHSALEIVFHVDATTSISLTGQAWSPYPTGEWLSFSGGGIDVSAMYDTNAAPVGPLDFEAVLQPGFAYTLMVGVGGYDDTWSTPYQASFALEVVPEPSTAALVGLGLVLMGVRRRR